MPYKHLKLWQRPECYAGPSWPDWYVFMGQHRDSDALSRSNFICGLENLGGEIETVQVVRERHWAVGWVEWIGIRKDNVAACDAAEAMLEDLAQYPILDEEHFSDLEYSEASDYWASMSVRERADYCKLAHISIYSARRDYLPHDDNGALYELLRG